MRMYKISLVREYEEKGEDFDRQLSKHPTFRSVGFFKASPEFSISSIDYQKKVVRKQLMMMTYDDFDFDVELDGRERLMVFEKGSYGMDEAVYDQETRIPDHLTGSSGGGG